MAKVNWSNFPGQSGGKDRFNPINAKTKPKRQKTGPSSNHPTRGSANDLAAAFNVSRGTIRTMRSGQNWAWLG